MSKLDNVTYVTGKQLPDKIKYTFHITKNLILICLKFILHFNNNNNNISILIKL